MTTLFVANERQADETRVAATPSSVSALTREGFEVVIAAGAGESAHHTDEDYQDAGARIGGPDDARSADAYLTINPPDPGSLSGLTAGTVVVGELYPTLADSAGLVRSLMDQRLIGFALDRLPRISRAQAMDTLSSQASVSGYEAVILAAHHSSRMMPLMSTAAGTIRPARVVVMGAGVAGLQAIATAKRLGCVVHATDVRPETREQVQSVGGRFIDVEGAEFFAGEGGYAKKVTKAFLDRQREAVRPFLIDADVIIATAQVPGGIAPKLVSAEVVRDMRPGGVIVDLAARSGGNCELTRPGETYVAEGVTIVGHRNVAGLVPTSASMVFANNLVAIVRHLFPRDRKGEPARVDFGDEITRAAVFTFEGKLLHADVGEAHGIEVSEPPSPPAPASDGRSASSPSQRLQVAPAAATATAEARDLPAKPEAMQELESESEPGLADVAPPPSLEPAPDPPGDPEPASADAPVDDNEDASRPEPEPSPELAPDPPDDSEPANSDAPVDDSDDPSKSVPSADVDDRESDEASGAVGGFDEGSTDDVAAKTGTDAVNEGVADEHEGVAGGDDGPDGGAPYTDPDPDGDERDDEPYPSKTDNQGET